MPSPKMPTETSPAPADPGRERWNEMLGSLAGLLPAGPASVLIDGAADQRADLATRLAAALNASGRSRVRLSEGEGNENDGGSWDVVIWLRTAPARHDGSRDGEDEADIVIDMHNPDWPVIRRVSASFAARGQWYLTETRAFFACRAATWDTKFGDDLLSYAAAVAQAGIRRGGVVIDVGCGTGRALPPLRQAVGPSGTVVAVDVTPEMLSQAGPTSLEASATRVLADARSLPFADASADAIFAAGLVNHLPDAEAGFGELARIVRPGGLLVLFHPSGRAALAARHGRRLSPDEPLAAVPLRRLTEATGWRLTAYDDAVNRFFAVAERVGGLSRARPAGPHRPGPPRSCVVHDEPQRPGQRQERYTLIPRPGILIVHRGAGQHHRHLAVHRHPPDRRRCRAPRPAARGGQLLPAGPLHRRRGDLGTGQRRACRDQHRRSGAHRRDRDLRTRARRGQTADRRPAREWRHRRGGNAEPAVRLPGHGGIHRPGGQHAVRRVVAGRRGRARHRRMGRHRRTARLGRAQLRMCQPARRAVLVITVLVSPAAWLAAATRGCVPQNGWSSAALRVPAWLP